MPYDFSLLGIPKLTQWALHIIRPWSSGRWLLSGLSTLWIHFDHLYSDMCRPFSTLASASHCYCVPLIEDHRCHSVVWVLPDYMLNSYTYKHMERHTPLRYGRITKLTSVPATSRNSWKVTSKQTCSCRHAHIPIQQCQSHWKSRH